MRLVGHLPLVILLLKVSCKGEEEGRSLCADRARTLCSLLRWPVEQMSETATMNGSKHRIARSRDETATQLTETAAHASYAIGKQARVLACERQTGSDNSRAA